VVLFRVSETIAESAIVDSEAFCASVFLSRLHAPGYSDTLLEIILTLMSNYVHENSTKRVVATDSPSCSFRDSVLFLLTKAHADEAIPS
jgi:hypothetical protein